MNEKNKSEAQRLLDKQWPGFEVRCKKCGSTLVELVNSLGRSELSGAFGSIDFSCVECDSYSEIYEP